MLKLAELCGSSVNLRCQLPTEDLDALVSITCDEDLANLIEEYDRASPPPSSLKIRAFLSPPKPAVTKKPPSPPSSSSASSSVSPRSPPAVAAHRDHRCLRQIAPLQATALRKSAFGKVPYCAYHHAQGNPSHTYLYHDRRSGRGRGRRSETSADQYHGDGGVEDLAEALGFTMVLVWWESLRSAKL